MKHHGQCVSKQVANKKSENIENFLIAQLVESTTSTLPPKLDRHGHSIRRKQTW